MRALLALVCSSVLAVLLGGAATAASPATGRIAYSAETGAVSLLGSAPDSPLVRPRGLDAGAAPATVARAFLARLGPRFGIDDEAQELRVRSVRAAANGRDVVRFQQVHDGVPVLGGELVVNLDADGNALSVGGEALPAADVSVAPAVPAGAARLTALEAIAGAEGVALPALRAGDPALTIYDSRILGGPGTDEPTLVWSVGVTGPGLLSELVLVDARRNTVALHFDQVKRAKVRQVCDAANVYAQLPCTAPVRSEGGPSGGSEVDDAYEFAGDVYDFYFSTFGRDSLDGQGMALKSTVRFCTGSRGDSCPWPNAAWDVATSQIVYGEGYAHADDVVGHELAHGVTSFSSKLFSYYQSGAIDESISDIFGELVDQTNGRGNDDAGMKWFLGEDIPGGPIRYLADPTSFGDPDRMGSPFYWTSSADDGGVHANNGVGNKAAYLMVEGGTFNGKTVNPALGIEKTARIFYEADTNLLTPASDYLDLYNALLQACANLTGTAGITGTDCGEVKDAVEAVEMNVPRVSPLTAPRNVVAVAGSGSATLSWAAPAVPAHGAGSFLYVITPVVGGAAQAPINVPGPTTSANISGLTNGTTYVFRVKTMNEAGFGLEATSNAVTPRAAQAIAFNQLPDKAFGATDFNLTATASSGLPVSYTAGGSCTVSGVTVHLIGAGTCTITAAQAGNAAYLAAQSVTVSFTVAKGSQSITFGSLRKRTVGEADFRVSARASSGLSVSFSARGSCTISGTRVHLTRAGTCTVTASQPGDEDYDAAPSVSQAFAVGAPLCRVPAVTGKTLAAARAAITKSRCRTGAVRYASSKKVQKGKVVSQSRPAGRQVAARTKVDLVVSRGPEKR